MCLVETTSGDIFKEFNTDVVITISEKQILACFFQSGNFYFNL